MSAFFLDVFIPYRDSADINFRIRKQLPFIMLTNLFMLVTFALLLPIDLVSSGGKINLFIILLSLLVAVLAGALVVLRMKNFTLAAWLVTLALFGSCMAVVFTMPLTGVPAEAYRSFAFIAVVFTCNVLVALDKRQIRLFYSLSIAGWLIGFATVFKPFFQINPSVTFAICIVGVLGLSAEAIVLLFVKRLSDELLDTAEKETAAAHSALADLKRLLEDAREGMAIGDQILTASGRVQKSLGDVEAIQDYLSGGSERLVRESDNFLESSETVMSSALAMKSNMEEQNSAITETSAAITEISANLANISGIATKRREMLNEISRGGTAQKELVKKLMAAMTTVQKSSEGIGVFVHTVQDVASRTGLLSMNASIEAARAGTHGKGFAVIAQEIRTLSEETAKNADTIKRLLDENDQTVQTTHGMMRDFSAFIEKSVADTRTLMESIEEILRGITEMDTGTREVMQAAQDIVTAAQDSAEMVNTVVGRFDSQKAGFSHIASFSAELHERIRQLEEAVRDIRSASDMVAEAGRQNTVQVHKLQLQGSKD